MEYYTYETKKIEICEVDYMGEYQLCHLFNRFAEIATINAQMIGLWNQEMMNQYGWVVAKQELHLEQPICFGDVIELSTIVDNGSFVSFPRYYFLKKDDKVIGTCSSVWTLLDMQKRRIVSPKRIGLIVPEVHHNEYLEPPHDIVEDIDLDYMCTRQVLYSDVDTNQHMNNTRYIQWAFDIIDYTLHKESFVSDLTIQYKKEIKPLESVELYLGQKNNRIIVEGRKKDNELYFIIEFVLKKRSFS